MIAKISRGASVRGLANYLHGPGKANEHVYEGVVGGRVIGGTLGAEGASDGSRWAVDMAAVMGQRPDVEKPVWHMSLRLPAKDRTLSDAQWRDVAQEMGERMGWDSNPWVMVRHGQDHVHVVVSRVGWDGELWHGRNDFREAQKARQGVEQRMGLSQTTVEARRDVSLSQGEHARALRTGEVTGREVLTVKVRAAVEASMGLGRETFEKVLDEQGVAYRANVASTGRVSGYSFALPDREKLPIEWVWFKASQLGKDLAWSRMQPRLDAPLPEPKITEPERKLLERRSRHQERIEAARNQARAKDLQRRRVSAPSVAKRATQDQMKGRAMQWRTRRAVSARTAFPKQRAARLEAERARDIAMAGFPSRGRPVLGQRTHERKLSDKSWEAATAHELAALMPPRERGHERGQFMGF